MPINMCKTVANSIIPEFDKKERSCDSLLLSDYLFGNR